MSILMLLFPIFFMIHEFEEIIMVEKWMGKYRTDLYMRFPVLSHRIAMLTEIDTRSFSIIVAEEFLIVSVLTIISVMTGNIIFWYCGLSAFSIHLLIHLLFGVNISLQLYLLLYVRHTVFGHFMKHIIF